MAVFKAYRVVLIILIIGSCVDPFKVPDLERAPKLVVDGLITTDPGPHKVKLTSSFSLNELQGYPVTGAAISILDDLGNVVFLNDIGGGEYQVTPVSWQAQLGRSYRLRIVLADGRQYESVEQLIYEAGSIDSLYFAYARNAINAGDLANEKDAFLTYANTSGSAELPNLFRWRWRGTYEIFTRPELTQAAIPGCCLVPAPLPCSGFNTDLVPVNPCTCCTCWVTEFSRQALVSENEYTNASQFKGVEIAKIPVDGLRFYNKYYIEVEQLSLDESSYTFWKLVNAQQSGATNIFQPNVIRMRGNVRNVTDSQELVLGVVSFASVTRASMFIYQDDIEGNKPSLPIIVADCRDYNETSTTEPPPFW
ncbi:MAG: DUF4249 domain-containing protein [Cyclobacteriaceae bacterium]|nr:DUF4249 domain-containing protein [Cyclobacteriaceae bacterium]